MAEFKSEGGAWYPKNKAAEDLLKERNTKTLGKVPTAQTETEKKATNDKEKGKKK